MNFERERERERERENFLVEQECILEEIEKKYLRIC